MKNNSVLANILPNGNLELIFIVNGITSIYLIKKDAISNFMQTFHQEKQALSC